MKSTSNEPRAYQTRFDALTTFLGDNLDFHGEQHTDGAGEWLYQTAVQIMQETDRPNGQSLDDLQEEIDDVQSCIDGVVHIGDDNDSNEKD